MKPVEYFFIVSLAVAIACGFIFSWHAWNRSRSKLSFIVAVSVTVLLAVITAFTLATLAIYILSL
ncbi:MAG: hypothetical protein IKL24_02675 [Clostridia bacterium]|nr:hypothetical protein [Clostridia bacterium]